MEIAGLTFQRICKIEPDRDEFGAVIAYLPQSRYANARRLPLNKYGAGPFCRFKIPTSYFVSGVYILTVNDEPKYVGECRNPAARYNAGYGSISPKNCFKGGQETNCRVNTLIHHAIATGAEVVLWFHPSEDFKSLELTLLGARNWEWNRR